LREKAKETYNRVRLERYNYYTGKAPAEVYIEEPFPYKVRDKEALQRYMDADDKLNKVDLKIRYYDVQLKFLEEVIKNVSNRTFQIKNAIEWHRFQAGFN
jgi:hypothetical protein